MNRSLVRELLFGSGAYTLGILLSRGLAALRDALVQRRFGPGFEQDAFALAESVPRRASAQLTNLQRSATVPLLGQYLAAGKSLDAWRLQAWAMVFTGVALLLTAGVIALYPDRLASLITPRHYSATEEGLVSELLAILMLTLIVEGVAGLATAGWLATRRYALPGLAHVLPNAVVVVLLFRGGAAFTIRDYAVSDVIGGAVFALVVTVPFLFVMKLPRALGWPPPWGDLGRVCRFAAPLLAPALLGPLAFSVQRLYAGSLEFGVLSCFRTAQATVQGPLGAIVAAMGTVLLPILAYQATRGRETFRSRMVEVLRLVLLLTAPAVLMMAIYAPSAVRLLFERGAFTPEHTALTAGITRVLAWQMLLAASLEVYTQGYLAVEDSRIVSAIRVVSLLMSTAVCVVFFGPWGLHAILGGELVGPAVGVALFAGLAKRRIGGETPRSVLPFLLRLAAAMALPALGSALLHRLLPMRPSPVPFAAEAPWLTAHLITVLGLYIAAVRLILPAEYAMLRSRLRRHP